MVQLGHGPPLRPWQTYLAPHRGAAMTGTGQAGCQARRGRPSMVPTGQTRGLGWVNRCKVNWFRTAALCWLSTKGSLLHGICGGTCIAFCEAVSSAVCRRRASSLCRSAHFLLSWTNLHESLDGGICIAIWHLESLPTEGSFATKSCIPWPLLASCVRWHLAH